MSKYLTVKEYANIEGIGVQAVYNRISRGSIDTVFVNVTLVDKDSYKPKKAGRPSKEVKAQ